MKHLLKATTFLVAYFLLVATAQTQTPTPIVSPVAPNVAGNAHYLVDFHSGKVLSEKNSHEQIEPASLTKIMTAYIVFNELKNGRIQLEDKVTISTKAWKMPGSRMFIEVGKQVSVEDLIKGMIIQSGNDASVALAEYISRTEEDFVLMMNEYAANLGMQNTNFLNSTGLPDPNHLTTAYDLAILTQAMIKDFPEYYNWYSEKQFTFNGITQYNRNRLLWQDPSVDGVKTGHTNSAGYCLVSSAERNNTRVIAVLTGADNGSQRITESQKLLNYAFRFFETHKLYEAEQRLVEARVWGGEQNQVGVGLAEEFYITVPKGQYNKLQAETVIPAELNAPLQKGDLAGELVISLDGEILETKQLIVLNDIAEGSFFKRLIDQIKQLIGSIF